MMDGDRVEGVMRYAGLGNLVEISRLTVDGLEVRIVFLLDADGVDVIVACSVGQQCDEDILGLGIADLQIEVEGRSAAKSVHQQRVGAVNAFRLDPKRVSVQRVGAAVSLLKGVSCVHQILNRAVDGRAGCQGNDG